MSNPNSLRIEKAGCFRLPKSAIRNPQSAIVRLLFLLIISAGLCVAQQAQTPAADASAATSDTGAITGHVTSDDGRALSGATVHISKAYVSTVGADMPVSTDDDGNFTASGLAPGLYNVNANMPGYVNVAGGTTSTGDIGFYRPGDTVNIRLAKGGVITGTVRDSNNEPVIAVMVRAIRVRDERGHSTSAISNYFQFRMTDDRGIYRIYGLSPGSYIVSAGGSTGFAIGVNGYDGDAPTFYPSSTRDTAAEVSVHAGDETTNIDIRYRGDHGHTISGTINSSLSEQGLSYAVSLTLRNASSGSIESNSFMTPGTKPTFALQGVGDGTYDLVAQQMTGSGNSAVSTPRRITVKGMDVTGVELTLTPLGSIAGRATLEPVPNKEGCADPRHATLNETLINARSSEKSPSEASQPLLLFAQGGGGGVLTDQGEFTIRNLSAGTYRLTARLPADRWYIRSISLRNAQAARTSTATAPSRSVTPAVITLKAGENFTGASLAIAQDGATVRGQIEMTKEGAEAAAPAIPDNLKIFLVPAEKERADDVLRYAEIKPNSNGQFTIKNLAPGRYLVIARLVAEETSPERVSLPLVWDSDARAKLRHDAEAANTALELQPCQRAVDYVLKYQGAK